MIRAAASCLILAALGCATPGPAPLRPLVQEGQVHFQHGDLDPAIDAYTRALAERPDDASAYGLRGQAYEKRGRLEAAIGDYARWAALAPRDYRSWLWLAHAQASLGRWADAAASYQRSLRRHEVAANRVGYAKALWRAGRPKDAARQAAKAGTAEPSERLEALLVQAAALSALGEDRRALEAFAAYMKDTGRDPPLEYDFERGRAYWRLGATSSAAPVALKLVEAEPAYEARFSGARAPELFDLERRGNEAREALAKADRAEAAGRLPEAFEAAAAGWSAAVPDTPEAETLRLRLLALYPRLARKPPLPEAARHLLADDKDLQDYESPRREEREEGEEREGENTTTGQLQRLEKYARVLRVAPWFAPAYCDSALALARLTRVEEAIERMEHCVSLAPEGPAAAEGREKLAQWRKRGR